MNEFTIEQVLPHDHPMILLDQLIEFSENSASCACTVTPQSLFFDAKLNGVPSYVGIEYMAQSIAAYANANELSQNRSVEIGFLVSSRKYKCEFSVFEQGMALTINVEKIYKDENLSREIVAERLGVSNSYLSKIIKEYTHSNFTEIINSSRVEDVKKKLSDKTYDPYSLLNIGLEAGFKSKSTFFTIFKKHTGLTPKNYKETLK